MKNNFLKIGALLFGAAMIFTSCLKDKPYDNMLRGINYDPAAEHVVSIALTTTDTSNFILTSFGASSTQSTFAFVPVTIAGGVPATQDVHVVLALDTTLVTAYNLANGTSYTIPAASSYSLSSLTLTIPAGQSRAVGTISLIPSNFIGITSAIGVKIVSVDGGYQLASGNKSNGVFAFGIKNQYEGNYHAVGYFYHPSSPRPINIASVFVGTIDANTVYTNLGDLGNLVDITIDPVTNQVTSIVDDGAQPGIQPTSKLDILEPPYTPFAGSNPSIYNNTYDPATHTFYLRYGYLGGTGYREVEETLTLNP